MRMSFYRKLQSSKMWQSVIIFSTIQWKKGVLNVPSSPAKLLSELYALIPPEAGLKSPHLYVPPAKFAPNMYPLNLLVAAQRSPSLHFTRIPLSTDKAGKRKRAAKTKSKWSQNAKIPKAPRRKHPQQRYSRMSLATEQWASTHYLLNAERYQ